MKQIGVFLLSLTKVIASGLSQSDHKIENFSAEKTAWEVLLKNNDYKNDKNACKMIKDNVRHLDLKIKKIKDEQLKTQQELKNALVFDSKGTSFEHVLAGQNFFLKKENSAGSHNNCFLYSVYKNKDLLEKIVGVKRADEILAFRGAESNLNLQEVRKAIFEKIKDAQKDGLKIYSTSHATDLSICEFLADEMKNIKAENDEGRLDKYLNDLLKGKQLPVQIPTLVSHVYQQKICVLRKTEEHKWGGNLKNIEAEISIVNALIEESLVIKNLKKDYSSFQDYLQSDGPTQKDKVAFINELKKNINASKFDDKQYVLGSLKKIEQECAKPIKKEKVLHVANEDPYQIGEPLFVYFSGNAKSGHYEKLKIIPLV